MVEIPTSRSLNRRTPSGQIVQNAGPQPIVGRSLEAFGGDLSQAGQFLDRVIESRRAETEQAENIEAERRFLEFQRDQTQLAQEAGDSANPGATGFAEKRRADYIENARAFRESLPDRLRDQYETPLFQVEDRIVSNSLKFEQSARKEYFGAEISQGLTAIEGSLFADPDRYDELVQDGRALILETPDSVLSQAEKIAQVRDWDNKARLAVLNGVTPEERIKLLGGVDAPQTDLPSNIRQGITKGANSDVRKIVTEAAQRYGVDPEALLVVGWLESKLKPGAKNPESSAGGLFQQIDSNARQYGVDDRFDAAQSADGAARFMADNARRLRSVLGREPTIGELYLAHQQGPGGATKLLTNPNATAADLVGADAVRLNGGDLDMTAAEFAGIWLRKAGDTHVPNGGLLGSSFDPDNADARFRAFDYIEAQKAIQGAQISIQAQMNALQSQSATQADDYIAWNTSGRVGDVPPRPDETYLSDSEVERVVRAERIGDAVEDVTSLPIESGQAALDGMRPSGKGFADEQIIHEAATKAHRRRVVQHAAPMSLASRDAFMQSVSDPVLRQSLEAQQNEYLSDLGKNQVGILRRSGVEVPDLDNEDVAGSIVNRFGLVSGLAQRNGVSPVLLTPQERTMAVNAFNEMDLAQKMAFIDEVSENPAAGHAFFSEISKSAPFLSHVGGMLNNGGDPDAAMMALRGQQAVIDGMKFDDLSVSDRSLQMSGDFAEAVRGMPDVMATADVFASNYARGVSIQNGGFVSPDDYQAGLDAALGETYSYNRPGLGRTKTMLLPPGVSEVDMDAFFDGLDEAILDGQNGGERIIDAMGNPVTAEYIRENADYMTVGPGAYVVEFDGEPVIGRDGGPFVLRYHR